MVNRKLPLLISLVESSRACLASPAGAVALGCGAAGAPRRGRGRSGVAVVPCRAGGQGGDEQRGGDQPA